MSKSVEKFKCFWHFLTIFDDFWRFLTWPLSAGPFCGPLINVPSQVGIRKAGIPTAGIPTAEIPKVRKAPHWASPPDRDFKLKARDSEVRDSEDRASEGKDSEGRFRAPLPFFFEVITCLIRKPFNHVTVIAENSWESRGKIVPVAAFC